MDIYWFEQNAEDVPTEKDWLSTDEARHLCGLRFEKRRTDWLLGRWAAKNAVATILGVGRERHTFSDIEIRPAPSGAPAVFFQGLPAALAISLSHRARTAACALAPPGASLGCDLEVIEPRGDVFPADYFTPEEQALVTGASATDRMRMVTLLWSAKESALKALGEGLRVDTRQVVVKLRGIKQVQRERVSDSSAELLLYASTASHTEDWEPLQVHLTGGVMFEGWWNQTGPLLRTLVAHPAPHPPISLRLGKAALAAPCALVFYKC